jgi:ribosome-binding protein aMBF1 (putative translation factor)
VLVVHANLRHRPAQLRHIGSASVSGVPSEVVPFANRPGADVDRDTAPKLREVIGEVLRDERHQQGRTLADVAEAAAVSLPYLSEIERGTKEVSSDLLEAVHTALGLDLGTVLERANRRLALRSQRVGVLRMAA